MAKLKANGAVVLRAVTPQGYDWRIMSNGVLLQKRSTGGGFRKRGKVKPDRTFGAIATMLRENGATVTVEAPAWLPLKPAPARRVMMKAPSTAHEGRWVHRVEDGLARAERDQRTR